MLYSFFIYSNFFISSTLIFLEITCEKHFLSFDSLSLFVIFIIFYNLFTELTLYLQTFFNNKELLEIFI